MATRSAAEKSAVSQKSAGRAKGSSGKTSLRKYSPSAGKNVEIEIQEMKKGNLRSGQSGKKVTNRKQAIAIGLSKARKEGKKVPPEKS